MQALVRHRLDAALGLALALALLTATASSVGPSQHLVGTTSPTSASLTTPDDGRGDVAATATPQPLPMALLVALAVLAFVLVTPGGADASQARLARAPPRR